YASIVALLFFERLLSLFCSQNV
ncbi:uncharacterized protein Dvir_GJ26939, partial [Drosophila virilis]